MESRKPYPWFYAVNDRPVKFVELPSGELDVLVYDFDTGELVSDLSYMSRPFEPGKDIDELTEEQFNQIVAGLRSQRDTDWMTLSGGRPAEPDSLDELANARRPHDFWRALFQQLANVDVSASTTVEESEIPRDERVTRGYCGTSDVGYRWNERESLESSMFPTEVTDEIYGLPGVEAIWNYRLAHVGQAGRAGFRHIELRVRFKSDKERDTFSAEWQRVFDRSPSFA